MAILFPKIDPSEIDNPGERKVAQALTSKLSSKAEVFHSFNWLRTNSKGTVEEGECDFVVVDPAQGILFVEVKGGSLEYDTEHSVWVRIMSGGKREVLKKDPFSQAQRSMHEIVKRIKEKFPSLNEDVPFTYGYAVAFPDCKYTGSLPANMVPDLVLDARKCLDLFNSISKVFDRFSRKTYPELSSRDIQTIHEALLPKFSLVPVIWRRVEDQEERLHRLTNEQQFLLTFMGNHSRAAIQGVAGSGKTILALAKAQESARNGIKTLFLCYNRPLKEWLKQAVPDDPEENLVITNYHGLVDDFCRKANMSIFENADTEDEDFWNNQAPEHLISACEVLGKEHKFDSIIVDEGQDFRELWWTSLEDVFCSPDEKFCFYVFFDPNQNIYLENPVIPKEFGKPFELPVNCRNTVKIAEHCSALIGCESTARTGAPMGDEPEYMQARDMSGGFKKAGKQVRKWCMTNAGGLKYSQVVVLAPSNSKNDWPKEFQAIPATTDFEEWRQNKGVLISSWGRFKGLEADAVIIVEQVSPDSGIDDIDRYVARSRAKHLLVIVQVHDS